VRDYIHVVDLSLGHIQALRKIMAESGVKTYNLGTGQGYSVLEVIQAFEQTTSQKVTYRMAPRRPGDIAECYADVSRARKELGWEAHRSLAEMCADAWRAARKQ
jgi:UDP-glucose 4-epimerase